MKKPPLTLIAALLALTLSASFPVAAHAAGNSPEGRVHYKTETLRWTESLHLSDPLQAEPGLDMSVTLTLPNYLGSVEAELVTSEGTITTPVQVVYLPDNKWDGDAYYSALTLRFPSYMTSRLFTGSSPLLGWKELYSYGFLPIDGGAAVFSSAGAQLHLLAGPGLYSALMTLPYTLTSTGLERFDEAMALVPEQIGFTASGLPFLLVLNDTTLDYFMEKGQLAPGATFPWPGLAQLIEEARYVEEPEVPKQGLHNFVHKRPYTPGMFLDIPFNASHWFDPYVEKAVRLNLMVGYTDGRFLPGGDVQLSEVVALAARVHNIYAGESGEFTLGPVWYNVYVRYAQSCGILAEGDFDRFDRPASRGEMAYILSRALPPAALKGQNRNIWIPDVGASTPYRTEIVALYEAGILSGYEDGSFKPASTISRSETASILARLVDEELRVKR